MNSLKSIAAAAGIEVNAVFEIAGNYFRIEKVTETEIVYTKGAAKPLPIQARKNMPLTEDVIGMIKYSIIKRS